METLYSVTVGILTACSVFLILRGRSFPGRGGRYYDAILCRQPVSVLYRAASPLTVRPSSVQTTVMPIHCHRHWC